MRVFRVKYVSGAMCDIRCETVEYSEGVFVFKNRSDYPLIIRSENVTDVREVTDGER